MLTKRQNDKIEGMNEYSVIEKLIYKNKCFDEAIDLINASKFCNTKKYRQLKADAYFKKEDFEKAAVLYSELQDFYQLAQCYLLLNQIDLAIEFFKKSEPTPAQNWGLFFAELFRGRFNNNPSYLQIRAFLERDLNLFLRLNLTSHVQKIIDISEYLFDINPETNKFIAKAFLNNGYPDYAKEYLDRAFEFTNQDAELYYLLAKYYEFSGQKDKIITNLEEALRLSENYVPALIMLERVRE